MGKETKKITREVNDWQDAGPDDWKEVNDWEEEVLPDIQESLARGSAQGLTLGFQDEGVGAWDSPMGAVKKIGKTIGFDVDPNDPDVAKYVQSRDKERARNELAAKTNPKSYHGSGLASSIVTSLIPGVGTAANGSKVAKGLLHSAKLGGLMGLGQSTSDDLQGQAINTGVGVAGGLLGEAGARTLGAGAKAIGKSGMVDRLRDFAEGRMLKQAGTMLNSARGLKKTGKFNEAGRAILDDTKLGWFPSTKKIAERATEVLDDEATPALLRSSDMLDGYLAAAQEVGGRGHGFKPNQVANKIRAEVVNPLLESPALADVGNKVDEFVTRLEKMGEGPLTFKKASRIKSDFDKLVNYTKDQPGLKNELKKVRGMINEEIERSASNLSADAQRTGTFETFKGAKKKYGTWSDIQGIAEDKVTRNLENRFISPSDYASGIAGAIYGGGDERSGGDRIAGGLMGLGANRLMRNYGNAIAARGADAMANKLAKYVAGRSFGANSLPAAFGLLGSKFDHKTPQPGAPIAPTPNRQPQNLREDLINGIADLNIGEETDDANDPSEGEAQKEWIENNPEEYQDMMKMIEGNDDREEGNLSEYERWKRNAEKNPPRLVLPPKKGLIKKGKR